MNIILFLKGILMGICDLIPGISGGTIALITGIYDKLITNIKNVLSINILKKRKSIDFKFLITLFIGIFTAIILGSQVIGYLLITHTAIVFSFFIGLILSSTYLIFEGIKNKKINDYYFLITGIFFGLLLTVITPSIIPNPSAIQIFTGGFFAIFAMLMPGISGSLILLILGLYEPIILMVKNFQILSLIPFFLGAIIGAITISRIITYLLKKSYNKTMMLLTGLIIGSVMNLFLNINVSIQSSIVMFFGIAIVFLIHHISKK